MLKLIILRTLMIPLMSNYWIMCNMVDLMTLIFMMYFSKNVFTIVYTSMMQIDKISFS